MQKPAFYRAKAIAMALASAAAGALVPHYISHGHGEGLTGNKHAKSSFKQNKRRGL